MEGPRGGGGGSFAPGPAAGGGPYHGGGGGGGGHHHHHHHQAHHQSERAALTSSSGGVSSGGGGSGSGRGGGGSGGAGLAKRGGSGSGGAGGREGKVIRGSAPDVFTKIADLRPYMKSINCLFIVLEKGAVTKTKENHTISDCLVADGSAAIRLSLWDRQGESLQPGDIIKLSGGYCTLFKNSLILYSGRHGHLERVGEFTMLFAEAPNMSMLSWVATNPNNPKSLGGWIGASDAFSSRNAIRNGTNASPSNASPRWRPDATRPLIAFLLYT
ncbi:SOSS complex subunit B1 [Balamuthia mandrillaris]